MKYHLIPIPNWPLEKSTLRFLQQQKASKVFSNNRIYICEKCVWKFNRTFRHCQFLLRTAKDTYSYSYYCEIKDCSGPRSIQVESVRNIIGENLA